MKSAYIYIYRGYGCYKYKYEDVGNKIKQNKTTNTIYMFACLTIEWFMEKSFIWNVNRI